VRLTAAANQGTKVTRSAATEATNAATGVLAAQPTMQPANDGTAPSRKNLNSTSPGLAPSARMAPICTVRAPTASHEIAKIPIVAIAYTASATPRERAVRRAKVAS